MNQDNSTMEHSWFNLNAHIPRKNGSYVRCNIRELHILPYVCFRVDFRHANVVKHKRVSPYQLLVHNKQWIRCLFLSDDDGCDVTHEHYIPEPQLLPKLELNDHVYISDVAQAVFSFVVSDMETIEKALEIDADIFT